MYPLLEISSTIRIPTYLLLISLIYSFAIVWVVKRADKRGLDRDIALDFCLAIMIGGLAGARLVHVFYEEPVYYFENPLEIITLWQGGFVFYGGAWGALLASLFVFQRHQVPKGIWFDFFAPVFALGYSIGRLGCLLAGCCYGKVCSWPWAIPLHGSLRHPTQIYASVIELMIFGFLLFLEKKTNQFGRGRLFIIWIGLHSINRLIMEFFRDDPRGPEVLGLSLSTAISGVLLFTSLFLFTKARTNN